MRQEGGVEGDEDIDDYSQEQIIQTILELGNQVLANLGVEEQINDVSVFFSDQFYIRFFEQAFPDIDFSSLDEAQTEEDMANNIQALIDLLAEEILKYDLDHIKGDEIVAGNPEHCINFLQLTKEVSSLINPNQQQQRQDDDSQGQSNQDEIDNQQPQEDLLMKEMRSNRGQIEPDHHGVDDEDEEDERQALESRRRRGALADQSQEDRLARAEQMGESFEVEIEGGEDEIDPLNVDEVSVRLEDAAGGDIMNLQNLQQQKIVDQYGEEELEDEPEQDQSDKFNQQNRQQQYQDPLELAQEAMMGQADEADQEIAKIINSQNHQYGKEEDDHEDDDGYYDEEMVVDEKAAEEAGLTKQEIMQLMQQQKQNQHANSSDQLQQHHYQQQQQQQQQMEENEEMDDDEQEGEEVKVDEEGNELIHSDLIAAVQQMGLELNSDQMRELQNYIAHQNNFDQSEEAEYDVEVADQQELQIQDHNQNQESRSQSKQVQDQQQQRQEQEYGDEEEMVDGEEEDEDKPIDLNNLKDDEKYALLQYIKEEYDKNPESFPFPREQLDEIIASGNFDFFKEHIRQLQQKQQEDEEDDDEQAAENIELMHIEGGEQQIEQDEDYEPVQQQHMQQPQVDQYQQKQPKKKKKQRKSSSLQRNTNQQMTQSNSQKQLKKAKKQQQQQGFDQIQFTLPPGAENMQPEMLQQILLQQQQQQQQQQQELKAKKVTNRRVRPQTAKVSSAQPSTTYGKYIMQQQTSKMSASTANNNVGQQSERGRPSIRQSKRRRSKKAKKTTAQTIQQQEEQVSPQNQELPFLDEAYLNQLNEEQLQLLLAQQTAMMDAQKQQQQLPPPTKQKSRSAGKRSSSADRKTRQQRAKEIYLNPQQNLNTITMSNVGGPLSGRQRKSSAKKRTSATKKTRKGGQPGQGNQPSGVMMNNFFPTLNEQQPANGLTAEEIQAMQLHQAMLQNQEGVDEQYQDDQNMQLINEVPLEEEEGESQDVTQSRKMGVPQQQMGYTQQPDDQEIPEEHHQQYVDQQDDEEQEDQEVMIDDQLDTGSLTEEQLMQLLQNHNQLDPAQQQQILKLFKQKKKKDLKSQKKQQYNNIYKILTDNVAKAKIQLANLNGNDNPRRQNKDDEETLERIRQQKREYDALVRQNDHSVKTKQRIKEVEQRRAERAAARETKLAQLREKKFEEELLNQQKSLMYKRNAQQVRLCQKVYKLASDLEKNKLLEEKKEFRETQAKKKLQKKSMVDNIEAFYRDKIGMLKERIETERFERKIAQQAQQEALSRMKREVTQKKKMELQKYLALLKQEDQKFDFQSQNLVNLEQEIIKLYKK